MSDREEFEKWAKSQWPDVDDFDPFEWEAWQASRAAALEEAAKELRNLQECVLDLCACLDVAGEAFKLDVEDDNATDYFITVSNSLGAARVSIGNEDYYAKRYEFYRSERIRALQATK